MKQSKRMLCVVISLVMMLSILTVGVSAYSTKYNEPAKYNDVNMPVYSAEQAATAFLDQVDKKFDNNSSFYIKELDYTVKINSIDSFYDFLHDIYALPEYEAYKDVIDLGDFDKLDRTVPNNKEIRRSSKTMSDLMVLKYTLEFLSANYKVLAKAFDGTFDFGMLNNTSFKFVNIVKNTNFHDKTVKYVYYILNKNTTGYTTDMKLDDVIQDFINHKCITFVVNLFAKSNGKNPLAEFLKYPTNSDGTMKRVAGILDACPSLKSSDIDITKVATCTIIKRVIYALIDDNIIPNAGGFILDTMKIGRNNKTANTQIFDVAIEVLAKNDASLGIDQNASRADTVKAFLKARGVANYASPTPIEKVNALVEYFFHVTIHKLVYTEYDANGVRHLKISEQITKNLKSIVVLFFGALAKEHEAVLGLLPDNIEALVRNDADDEGTLTYIVKFVYMYLKENVDPDKPLAFKKTMMDILVSLAKDYVPSIDFDSMIESGKLNPNSTDFLRVAAVIVEYYFVRELGMKAVSTPSRIGTPSEIGKAIVRHLFARFKCYFNPYLSEEDYNAHKGDVWYLLYNTVNQWVPFTKIFVGVEDSPAGLRDLVINKFLNNIRTGNIEGVISTIGLGKNSELYKTPSQLLANMIARMVNGAFKLEPQYKSDLKSNEAQLNLIVPYTYKTLDEIIANTSTVEGVNKGTGFQNTAKQIFKNCYRLKEGDQLSIIDNGLVYLEIAVGLLRPDKHSYMTTYLSHIVYYTSVENFIDYYYSVVPASNKGLGYDNSNYTYFNMIDFAPWAYRQFNNAAIYAKQIVDIYERGAVTDIKYVRKAYTRLLEAKRVLDANETVANDVQLQKLYNEVSSITFKDADGKQLYTEKTWKAFERARNFASKVISEFASSSDTMRQSKINMARRMLEKAYKALLEYTGLADYTEVDAEIERVLNLKNPAMFTDASVAKVVEMYKKAKALARNLDAYDQPIVDKAYDELHKAIEELSNAAYIEFFNTDSSAIQQLNDFRYKYVYGFDGSFWSNAEVTDWDNDFNAYFTYLYGYPVEGNGVSIKRTALGSGTGATISILDDPFADNPVKKADYVVVVFGDANGDAQADGMDAVLMKLYAAGMLKADQLTTYATDLDFDGTISNADIAQVENSGILTQTINQNPDIPAENQKTFADLVA